MTSQRTRPRLIHRRRSRVESFTDPDSRCPPDNRTPREIKELPRRSPASPAIQGGLPEKVVPEPRPWDEERVGTVPMCGTQPMAGTGHPPESNLPSLSCTEQTQTSLPGTSYPSSHGPSDPTSTPCGLSGRRMGSCCSPDTGSRTDGRVGVGPGKGQESTFLPP